MSFSKSRKARVGLSLLKQLVADLSHRHPDDWYRLKDRTAHYDIDGVSFEITSGVIVAGRLKSNRGNILRPHV